jgi:hypothetical protein
VLDEHAAVGSGHRDGYVSMAEVDPGNQTVGPTRRQKGCRAPTSATAPYRFRTFLDHKMVSDQRLDPLGNRAA